MKLNKYNLNRKLLAQLLLLSLGLNIIFDFKVLMASVPSAAALTQRAVMLKKISDPLNNTILNSANPFMQAPGPVPTWNLVWSSLKTKVETGNLQPSDLVNPVNSDLAVLTTANKFTSIYNNFYSQLAVDVRGTVLGDDANQSLLLSLLYFGADAPHDGSVFTEDDGVTLGNWYPAVQDADGNPRPIASFYAPDSVWFNTNAANNNFETPGGLLIKTQVTNNNFCAALDKTYGAGVWSGATCISNSDCCKDSTGVQQTCIKNSTIEKLVPQLTDPVTGETIVYGICDTLDAAVCGTALGAACNGTSSGPDIKPGCCMGDKLVCVNQDQAGDNITGNNFKCLADIGSFCNSNSDCALADSKCIENSCVAPGATVPPGAWVITVGGIVAVIALGIFFAAPKLIALFKKSIGAGAAAYVTPDKLTEVNRSVVRIDGHIYLVTQAADEPSRSRVLKIHDDFDLQEIETRSGSVFSMEERAAMRQLQAKLKEYDLGHSGQLDIQFDIAGLENNLTVSSAKALSADMKWLVTNATDPRGTFVVRPAVDPTITQVLEQEISAKLAVIKASFTGSKDIEHSWADLSFSSNAEFKAKLLALLLLEEAKAADSSPDRPVDYDELMREMIKNLAEKTDIKLKINPVAQKYTQTDFLKIVGDILNVEAGAEIPTDDFLSTKIGASTYQMCKDIEKAYNSDALHYTVTPEQVYSALKARMADSPLKDRFPDWRTAPATRAPDFPYDRFAK